MESKLTKGESLLIDVVRVLFALELLGEKLLIKVDLGTHFQMTTYKSIILSKLKSMLNTLVVNTLSTVVGVDKNSKAENDFVRSILNYEYFRNNESIVSASKDELLNNIILPFFTAQNVVKDLELIHLLFFETDSNYFQTIKELVVEEVKETIAEALPILVKDVVHAPDKDVKLNNKTI